MSQRSSSPQSAGDVLIKEATLSCFFENMVSYSNSWNLIFHKLVELFEKEIVFPTIIKECFT